MIRFCIKKLAAIHYYLLARSAPFIDDGTELLHIVIPLSLLIYILENILLYIIYLHIL